MTKKDLVVAVFVFLVFWLATYALLGCESFGAYQSRCYKWCAHKGGVVLDFEKTECKEEQQKPPCYLCTCKIEDRIIERRFTPVDDAPHEIPGPLGRVATKRHTR